MPSKRKRGTELAEGVTPSPSNLEQIRNMEEFAALGQYLFMFGVGALKLPDFGREELEMALLAPQSALVEQIQLTLIRVVTLNPRLVMEQFNEQARKQYLLHKPEANPFEGDDEVARSFGDMNIFTKIRVLHQLSVWTFTRPNQIREKMGGIDISEELSWRMEPAGYDSKENEYFILDDNRLYRRAASKETSTVPKKKKVQTPPTGRKRRRVSTAAFAESDEAPVKANESRQWACVCISPQDWEVFVASLKGSKDGDEKVLYQYLNGDVLPEIRRGEELKQKKCLDLEKERQKQQAVANRKRSCRIDEKMARRKMEEEKAAEARKQEELLKKTKAEERKRDKEREARLAAHERQVERQNKTREKKLQAQGVGSSRATSGDESSVNGRRASARVQTRRSQRSPSVEKKEGDWIFDCRCGAHGKKHAGGSTIIACDKCAIWQHLACQDLPPSFTEGDFTCERCRRREAAREASNHSRVTIKLRIGPSAKISTTDIPNVHDKNASPTIPTIPIQNLSRVSQGEVIEQFRYETQLVSKHSDSDRERKERGHPEPALNQNLSVPGKLEANGVTNGGGGNSVREEPAQASADFLLFMADPGHGTSDSQQPGNGNAAENLSLANGAQKPRLLESHEVKSQSQLHPLKLVNGTSRTAPGGFAARLPPLSSFTPFVENPSTGGISSSGKNDKHPYRENAHVQSMLASPTRSANA